MAATRWLTFDCYGTIADWSSCMLSALEPVAGAHADALLSAYHRAESILEAGPRWRPYRDVLTDGLALAAQRNGVALAAGASGALVAAWPEMEIFPDVAEALTDAVRGQYDAGTVLGKPVQAYRHEPDVAAHAKRIVTFRDGKILSDRSVESQEAILR